MDSDNNFTCNTIYVSIFATVNIKFNRWSGLIRYTVVAMLFLAMLTSLTSYTFFEQSHCATIECELDVDINEFDDTKLDGHFPFDLNYAGLGWIQFDFETPCQSHLLLNQKQHFFSFATSRRYIAFHSLKVFC